jgi:methionyl-tRNA formyltransferase
VNRVVVLTSSRSGIAAYCLPELCDSPKLSIAGVIVAGAPRRSWRRIRLKLRKLLRIGIGGALNGIRMRGWFASAQTPDVGSICARHGVPLFEVPQINSDETVEVLRRLEPDLGLSLGNSYIAPRIFNLPRLGMINVHGERLPEYQNAQSVIWPIYHNETRTGLSIHQIDKGIDTGVILHREDFDILFAPRLKDTVRGTIAITQARTLSAARFVCENYAELAVKASAQAPGRVFTTPSIFQYARMVWNNRRLYRASLRHGRGT